MRSAAWPVLSVALLAAAPARAQFVAAEPPGLTVRGTATVDEKPDTADLTVAVVTRGPTLDGTTKAHEARVAQAKAALDRLAADGATVASASFGLTEERAPVPPGNRPPDAPPTYRAENRYDLRSKDVGRVDALVTAIAATGLFEVDGVRYSVGDGGAARDRARRAALADARHQADLYADAAALSLDGISRIVDLDGASPSRVFDLPARDLRAASVGLSPPASIPFTESVTVTWRIEPR